MKISLILIGLALLGSSHFAEGLNIKREKALLNDAALEISKPENVTLELGEADLAAKEKLEASIDEENELGQAEYEQEETEVDGERSTGDRNNESLRPQSLEHKRRLQSLRKQSNQRIRRLRRQRRRLLRRMRQRRRRRQRKNRRSKKNRKNRLRRKRRRNRLRRLRHRRRLNRRRGIRRILRRHRKRVTG